MQPSSLIFVVIAGVWAAFFIQYWIRRREHIATARSVDAFSETMRVLKVRDHGHQVDLDGPPRPSYMVSPTKVVRPQVTVKRAETLLSRPLPDSDGDLPAWWGEGGAGPAAYLAIPNRATRGLVFLVGVLGTLVYVLLSITGVLVPWAAIVPFMLAAGGFVWLRRAAVAQAPERRRTVAAPATRAARVVRPAPAVAPIAAEPVVVPVEVVPAAARDAVFDVEGPAAGTPARRASHPVAPSAPAAAVTAPARPLVDDDDLPPTWDPRPVPRPTYATKATATWVPVADRAAGQQPVRPTRSAATPLADLDDDIPEVFPMPRRSAAG